MQGIAVEHGWAANKATQLIGVWATKGTCLF
jgi:hypothetical protein